MFFSKILVLVSVVGAVFVLPTGFASSILSISEYLKSYD
jgi:hypothetical protein